jgi:signal transduction histidine kinase
MFDRVWQQAHHTNAGLGLGLAIVRGIVETHGGELRVESTLGEGSRFSFSIPSNREEIRAGGAINRHPTSATADPGR